MKGWRLHSGWYKWVFNHSYKAVSLYMDWIRPIICGPEAPNFYGENMDVHRLKYRYRTGYSVDPR